MKHAVAFLVKPPEETKYLFSEVSAESDGLLKICLLRFFHTGQQAINLAALFAARSRDLDIRR